MTILNRALNKAYQRRSNVDSASALEKRPPADSGWAAKLREPMRPIRPVEDTAETLPTELARSDESLTLPVTHGGQSPLSAPAVSATAAPVRVDRPHTPAAAPAALESSRLPLPVQAVWSEGAGQILAPVEPRQIESRPSAEEEASISQKAETWSWPSIVQKLLTCSASAEIRKLAARLKHLASERSLVCLALTGPGRASGRTSLVLTLAHAMTDMPATRVAIVDADFGHPEMAQSLSLQSRAGLWDVACESKGAVAAITTLIPERLSIVPLVEPVSFTSIDRKKIGAMQKFLRSLRREYDVVLVDAGPWESLVPPLVFECRAIDAFLSVCRRGGDAEERNNEQLGEDAYQQPGVEWLGRIETFTPASLLQSHSIES